MELKQAFPQTSSAFRGMSLRDYFAAKAMAAFIASPVLDVARDAIYHSGKCAEWAYEQADEMIRAREAQS